MNIRRQISIDTYPRRDHFEHFLNMANPFLTVTVQVDISDWLPGIKKAGYPVFLSFQYAVTRAINRIPEFRQRIADGGIVEYDHCNPSYTYGLPDGTYRYCLVNADQSFDRYLREAEVKQAAALHADNLEEEGDVLSLLFVSCVPWVSWTAAQMPWPDNRFSIPNINWGRYTTEKQLFLRDGAVAERDKILMPVTLFANHALVDGCHVGRFFSYLDEELKNFLM